MEEVKNVYDKLSDRNKDLIEIATRAMLFAEQEQKEKQRKKRRIKNV